MQTKSFFTAATATYSALKDTLSDMIGYSKALNIKFLFSSK